jgi:hypothetical protein
MAPAPQMTHRLEVKTEVAHPDEALTRHGKVQRMTTTSEARTTLLIDPVAQELLQSTIPARLAYTWRDGTPRVIPIWFHWTGTEIVLGAPPNSPKIAVLTDRPAVSLTIDSNAWPCKVLLIRGEAAVTVADEPFPEWLLTAQRYLGAEAGQDMVTMVKQTFSGWARISIRPDVVHTLDFGAGKFPSAWSAGQHP